MGNGAAGCGFEYDAYPHKCGYLGKNIFGDFTCTKHMDNYKKRVTRPHTGGKT